MSLCYNDIKTLRHNDEEFMKKMMSVAELKKHFSEVLESILYLGDRFVILKRGKPVARDCQYEGVIRA